MSLRIPKRRDKARDKAMNFRRKALWHKRFSALRVSKALTWINQSPAMIR
jgi:hypothetical protein